MRARAWQMIVVSAALLLGSACSDTALDIQLVPDPNINDRAALLSILSSFQLTVDADPPGLYHDRTDQQGNLRIEDIDGDGAGELVATLGLPGDGRLPLVRLERGGLPDVAVHLSVDGLGDDGGSPTVLAAGGVRGVTFSPDEVQRIEVPFNIRPRYRPPRVTQLVPAPGTRNDQDSVGSVFVIFSKRMLRATIDGAAVGVYRVDGGSTAGELVASVERNIQVIPGEDSPTTLQYVFADPLDPGTYEVRVSAEARDDTQRRLDQVPMQKGDQPYAARFVVTDKTGSVATQPQTPQQGPFDCSALSCPEGTSCTPASGHCELASCPAKCDDGTVCSDAYHVCVLDCRAYGTHGGCPDAKRCDKNSGLCID